MNYFFDIIKRIMESLSLKFLFSEFLSIEAFKLLAFSKHNNPFLL